MTTLRQIDHNELAACLKEALVVVLNFSSPGSDSDALTQPLFEELAEESDDSRLMVCTIDFEEFPAVAKKYHVMSVPTTLVFYKGEVLERIVGVTSKAMIRSKLDYVFKNGKS